jgi:hypothetical protein
VPVRFDGPFSAVHVEDGGEGPGSENGFVNLELPLAEVLESLV